MPKAILGFTALLSVSVALAACRGEGTRSAPARAESAPNTPAPRAQATLYSPSGMGSALSALRERVAPSTPVLAIEVRPDELLIQISNAARDGVVAYVWTRDQVRGPLPVELEGSGSLANNVFAFSSVDLSRVPELARVARARVDAEHGTVTRILIRKNLPVDDGVGMRAYVDSPIRSGQLDADASGHPLP